MYLLTIFAKMRCMYFKIYISHFAYCVLSNEGLWPIFLFYFMYRFIFMWKPFNKNYNIAYETYHNIMRKVRNILVLNVRQVERRKDFHVILFVNLFFTILRKVDFVWIRDRDELSSIAKGAVYRLPLGRPRELPNEPRGGNGGDWSSGNWPLRAADGFSTDPSGREKPYDPCATRPMLTLAVDPRVTCTPSPRTLAARPLRVGVANTDCVRTT